MEGQVPSECQVFTVQFNVVCWVEGQVLSEFQVLQV